MRLAAICSTDYLLTSLLKKSVGLPQHFDVLSGDPWIWQAGLESG
jgi:hypothetical protein